MKYIFLLIFSPLLLIFLSGCGKVSDEQRVDDKIAYWDGYRVGQNFQGGVLEQTALDSIRGNMPNRYVELFDRGAKDGQKGKKPKYTRPTEEQLRENRLRNPVY